MRRHSHHGAFTVAHQHVVGDPDRQFFTIERVNDKQTGIHALFLLRGEVGYINSNSDSMVYIAEDKSAVQRGLETLNECPLLKKIVVIDTKGVDMANDKLMTFEQLKQLGKELDAKEPGLFEKLTDAVQIDDLATFVYTSGTTGHPKGAMITHKNILAVFSGLDAVIPAYDTDETVPFLPLCHVFERMAGHLYGMKVGITTHYAQDFNTLIEDIQEKKPTIILEIS